MALTFEKEALLRGPGSVWVANTPPAVGATIACDQDGKPSSGGLLIGYTRRGWTWNLSQERPAEEAWPGQEALAVVAPTAMTISAEAAELRRVDMLQYLMPSMYYTPASNKFTLGSPRKPLVYPCVTVVGLQYPPRKIGEAPQQKQYFLVCLYRCINVEDFGFAITRRDYASASFTFQGRPIIDRPPEDQIGQVQMYAAPETAAGEIQ